MVPDFPFFRRNALDKRRQMWYSNEIEMAGEDFPVRSL